MSEAFSLYTQPLYRARDMAICLKLSLCIHSPSIGPEMSEAFSVYTQPLYRARDMAICLKLSLCIHSHTIGPEIWLYV